MYSEIIGTGVVRLPNDDNIVVFKGRGDRVVVDVDGAAEFEAVVDALRRKVGKARRFFGSAQSAVTFKGRILSDEEQDALLAVFKEESDLSVLYSGMEREIPEPRARSRKESKTEPKTEPKTETKREAKQEVKEVKKEPENAPKQDAKPSDIDQPAGLTGLAEFFDGSLRSGQAINFSGNVVIWGDVNPGAEVTAGGHIVVIGALRGMAHAGCGGDENATITAMIFQPIQLRISDVINHYPKERPSEGRRRPEPKKAFLRDNVINVTDLL